MRDLTILFPCLNEEANIINCITSAKEFLKKNNLDGEILVVNNASTDNSKECALGENVRVIDEYKRGYGSTLISGINASNSKNIVMLDCDGTYNFEQVKEFLDRLDDGYDIIVGNRFTGKMEKKAMPFINKKIGNPLLSGYAKKKFNIEINDLHCGLRAFSKDKILKLNLKCLGMEFATEMIVKAKQNNYRMCEIPIKLSKSPNKRKSHLNPICDGYRHLKYIAKTKKCN